MTRASVAVAIVVSLLGAGLVPHAQQRFKTGVDAVRVDVLVTDGNKSVLNLTADDFELRDSGVVQAVDSVATADVPVSMMIALDVSGSVEGATLSTLQQGVRSALRALNAQDRAALVTFASDVRLAAAWTDDAAAVIAQVDAITPGGGTSLWDASFAALMHRDPTPTVRRLVVIFTDGDDTSSWLPRNSVIAHARRNDAVVYSITLKGNAPYGSKTLLGRSGIELAKNEREAWVETPFVQEIANATGGTSLEARGVGDLKQLFTRILTEFRTRYVLTYSPQGVDATGWHPIEVKVKGRGGKVQARRGYQR